MTSRPAQHAKTSDSTGLIAAVISAIIVLLGIVIVLIVIVLLVKKRYSNVMRKELAIFLGSTFIIEKNKDQYSMRMKWSAICRMINQNQWLRWVKLIPLRVKQAC